MKPADLIPAAGALALVLTLAGCATPGPVRLYVAPAHGGTVLDLPGDAADESTPPTNTLSLRPGETVGGLVCEPLADRLYVRLLPGARVRMIDRSNGRMLGDIVLRGLPTWSAPAEANARAGDLALHVRTRRLFTLHPTEPRVLEFTLRGERVQSWTLPDAATPAAGIACDQDSGHLLLLTATEPARIVTCTRAGAVVATCTLSEPVRPGALGYDSRAGVIWAVLRPRASDERVMLGGFSRDGRLVERRALPPTSDDWSAVDTAERSWLRMF